MTLTTVLLFVAGTAIVCCSAGSKFEPSVAFVCDRGAMHMHEDDTWVSDPDTDCMEGKEEVLKYCKKSYPALEITNIVESSDYKHIKGWCALGKSSCDTNEAFKVRPFRCLTGPFQSDALIVPKQCSFDHVHQPKQCHGFDWWSDVAHKACRGIKHMKLDNFAMLLPCGTDVFTGVEYVCCPKDANATETVDKTTKVKTEVKPVISIKIEPEETTTAAPAAEVDDKIVVNYLHMKEKGYESNEHAAFNLAKTELVRVNHDKVTKLMKDWAEARQRVLDLKKIDPKGAEKLNKEITPRYQKEYFALQATSDSKVLQLDAVHQQHVQANLDAKKRKTVEKLMHELQEDQPEPAAITKMLKRYISIEEKDAHHCIHHYTKIRDHDAAEGRQLLPTTLTHLSLISARINQSIGLLDTLDSDSTKTKILKEVNVWRSKTFNNINTYINTFKQELLSHRATKPPRTTSAPVVEEVVPKKEVLPVEKKPIIVVSDSKPTKESKGVYKQYAAKFAEKVKVIAKQAEEKALDDEDVKEDEHSYDTLLSPKVQVNHMAKGVALEVEANPFNGQSSTSGVSSGAGFAIAIGVVAGIAIIILTVVLAKKKVRGSKPGTDSYLEVSVEDNMSAEDRHVASMQNGYENPTYKLLEKRAM